MAQPLTVALPPNLSLKGGYLVRVTALDPATGNVVTFANVANVTLQVEVTSGDALTLEQGPFLLVPGPRG